MWDVRHTRRRLVAALVEGPWAYVRGLPGSVHLLGLGQFVIDSSGKITVSFLPIYLAFGLHASTAAIGVVLACPPLCGVVGQALAGAITDKVGRKAVLAFSLVSEALLLLAMAFVHSVLLLAVLNAGIGLTASAYWPASQVVVAELTRPGERVASFTFLYLATNVGAAVGPMLGAVLALTHHRLAFAMAACMLGAYAALLNRRLPRHDAPAQIRAQPFGTGYRRAFADHALLFFVGAVFLSEFAAQMNLSLFLVRMHVDHANAVYGAFMSVNGLVVVLTALFVARRVQQRSPTRMLALGCFLYALAIPGFAWGRSLASVVAIDVPFTVAEVILATVSPAYLAALAPASGRTAYMSAAAVASTLATAMSPLVTGVALELISPGVVLGFLAVLPVAASWLYMRSGSPRREMPAGPDAGLPSEAW